MIERISQSFIKDYQAYTRGEECGLIIKDKYVNDKLYPAEVGSSMHIGSYFEFQGTGALPKDGIEPKPEVMKSGKDLTVAYRIALKNALRLKGNPQVGIPGMLREMGLKVIAVRKHVTKGRFSGTLDLIVMVIKNRRFVQQTADPQNPIILRWCKGDKFVIDLKYSGLLEDRWSKHGWTMTPIQREYHGHQAKQYHLLSELPFYFMVFEAKASNEEKPSDVLFFHVDVSKLALEQHKALANEYFEQFQVRAKADIFEPRPSMKRCAECPLRAECKYKHDFPHPLTITL